MFSFCKRKSVDEGLKELDEEKGINHEETKKTAFIFDFRYTLKL